MRRPTAVVFARRPAWGAVKTRLAADVGRREALRFYRANLQALLRRLAGDRRWRTVAAVTPDRAARSLRLPPGAGARPQGRGDLGARMARAAAAFRGPVVIVGSDVPGVRPAHLARAFRALGRADAVFGPSGDGGFWLAGFANRRPLAGLFRGVRWSRAGTLADSLATVGPRRRTALLDALDDVDDGAGWARLRRPPPRPARGRV